MWNRIEIRSIRINVVTDIKNRFYPIETVISQSFSLFNSWTRMRVRTPQHIFPCNFINFLENLQQRGELRVFFFFFFFRGFTILSHSLSRRTVWWEITVNLKFSFFSFFFSIFISASDLRPFSKNVHTYQIIYNAVVSVHLEHGLRIRNP